MKKKKKKFMKKKITYNELLKRVNDLENKLLEKDKNNSLLDLIFQYSLDSIVLLDKDYNFVKVNRSYAESCAKKIEDFEGVNHFDLYPSPLKDEFELHKKDKTIFSIKSRPFVFPDHPEWETTYWDINLVPILNRNKEIEFFLFTLKDVTKRTRINQNLIKAKAKAEESDLLKSAFLANISHEIRTPMNGILGFSELIKTSKLTEDKHQLYVDMIESNSIRMLNTINDIIEVSKIETGNIELFLSETNINDELEDIYCIFKSEIKNKGLKFSIVNKLPSNETVIITDEEKFKVILINLIKNAIKYTNAGSIEFGCKYKGKCLEFFVKDTGVGIAIKRQEAIFERFVQADIKDEMALQGTGLGLTISKYYVELLGGKIWVESKDMKGSTFYFSVPYNGY